jgi:hypothetical protein
MAGAIPLALQEVRKMMIGKTQFALHNPREGR